MSIKETPHFIDPQNRQEIFCLQIMTL